MPILSVVATSPVPLGNTAEVKPENSTKAVNYNTSYPSTSSPMTSTTPPSPSFEFVTAPKGIFFCVYYLDAILLILRGLSLPFYRQEPGSTKWIIQSERYEVFRDPYYY